MLSVAETTARNPYLTPFIVKPAPRGLEDGEVIKRVLWLSLEERVALLVSSKVTNHKRGNQENQALRSKDASVPEQIEKKLAPEWTNQLTS